MIPKIIHCFWAGGPKTKLARKCRASWERFAPEWEIREFQLPSALPAFVREAVAARKWAMVSDWVRMRALHDEGGVYLDYDVELVAPIERLPAGEWVASEWKAGGGTWLNPGSGIALEKGSEIARHMLERYDRLAFDPKREMMAWINESLGGAEGLAVLEPEVMSPIGTDGSLRRTEKTVGIHRYAMSDASAGRKLARWLSWHGLNGVVKLLLRLKK